MKRLKIKSLFLFLILAGFFLCPSFGVWADDDAGPVNEKAVPEAPKTELDKLKGEWEAVREQQIQMIREKEDQLEKLKEEIFAKMKSSEVPVALPSVASQPEVSGAPGPILPAVNGEGVVPNNLGEIEAQKAALQAERQKFFKEMSRQKESLRQLQASLDEKTKQLEADRQSFDQQKKSVAP